MDKEKIIKFDIKTSEAESEKLNQPLFHNYFQTNPILQKMLLCNINNKKGKFQFKDLFK